MPAALASTATITGDIDYNGAVTGVVAAAVRGQPIKAVVFTTRSPVQGLMAKAETKISNNSNPKKSPSAHRVLRLTSPRDIL